MSALAVELLPHPLVVGVEQLKDALDRMPIDAWPGLEAVEIRRLSEELMRIDARVKAHLLAGARALDATGLAKTSGASSTGGMLAGAFGGDKRAADAMVHQGKTLGAAPATEQALANGKIGAAQADIIARAVKNLPDDVTPNQKQACEDTLIGDAGRLSLKDLKARSRRITDQFQPEPDVDAAENHSLEDEEKRAWAASEFWMRPNGNGTTTGGFTVPDAQADMLQAAVNAVSAPRRDHLRDHPGTNSSDHEEKTPSVYDRDLDYRNRLGMGFAEVCTRLPGHLLPGRSGLGATLMVRLDLKTLTDGIKAATLSTGTRLSASQTRLMACNLGLIPQVFNGKTLPVDHGHEQRLFTKAQKQDLAARDGGCAFPTCDKPPEQTEGHHWRQPWSHGATTTLADGVLLCPFHHRTIHTNDWRLREGPDGHIEFQTPGTTTWQHNHRWRP